MTTALRVDIVSDVMCPWCIIGYKQLCQALEASGMPYETHWHPFELNPNMSPAGQNMREHIAEKYGSTAEQSEQSRRQMTNLGADLGFEFNFVENMRMHNTFNAHQVLHWADEYGKRNELKAALFSAHFTYSRDLSDNKVLADVATEVGLDRPEALAILEGQRFADEVRKEQMFWTKQGISGVPSVIFDRQHLVTGAQGVDNYTSILSQLADQAN